VLRFERQVGAMLLKDMTIMKFMMSAILVGMVGVHMAVALGLAQLGPKATQIGANVVGGLLFGLGWAVMGSAPVPPSGRWPKAAGTQSSPFSGCWPGRLFTRRLTRTLRKNLLVLGSLGKITLPGVLGMSAWAIIPVLGLVFILLLCTSKKKGCDRCAIPTRI